MGDKLFNEQLTKLVVLQIITSGDDKLIQFVIGSRTFIAPKGLKQTMPASRTRCRHSNHREMNDAYS